jgi:hypothetical protein
MLALMNSRSSGEVAARCPSGWHVAQDARDRTYYCTPAHKPDAVLNQVFGQSLVIPIIVVLGLLLRRVRRSFARRDNDGTA